MAYKVISAFSDLKDSGYSYRVGDIYPHDGYTASENRIKELSTNANLRGIALIEEVRSDGETEQDKPAGVENEPRKRGRKRKTEE